MGQQASKQEEVSDGYMLTVAAREGHADVVALYLRKNAALALYVGSCDGTTAVHAACEGQHGILQTLLQTLRLSAASNTFDPVQRMLDQTNSKGMTALAIAASYRSAGHLACARCLQQCGCSVWVTDAEGRTCLHHAALSGNSTLIECLLNASSKQQHLENQPQQQGSNNRNPQAAVHRYANHADAAGRTALHYAVYSSDLETIHMLVTAGCSLTTAAVSEALETEPPVNKGATPLHIAAVQGDKAAVVLLLTAYVAAAAGALPELTHPQACRCKCEQAQGCSQSQGTLPGVYEACTNCSCCEEAGQLDSPLQDPRSVADTYGLIPYAIVAKSADDSLKKLLNPRTVITELLEALPDGPATQPGSRAAMLEAAAAGAGSQGGDQVATAYRQLVRALTNASNYLTKQRSQQEREKEQHEQVHMQLAQSQEHCSPAGSTAQL